MFSNLFPGFGIALVAFTAYVVVDQLVHPSNIEQLKKQAKESAERPSIIGLLKGGSKGQEQEQ
jgi:NADH dehydrogenase (ubiquinone) 1 beta subcomplex subunit 3